MISEKKIGFPTANLSAHNEQFPPNGVYLAEAKLGTVIYPGVVNLGYRPTVSTDKSERTLEINLLDFDRDIYAEDIEVRFIRYMSTEKNHCARPLRFASCCWQPYHNARGEPFIVDVGRGFAQLPV